MAASTDTTLGVKGIDHVTLVVADLELSRQFYVGLLGMTDVPRPDFGFPGLWFQAGNTLIHLNVESAESGPAGMRYSATKISRAMHFAFEVEDGDVAAQQLRDRGIAIVEGPRQRPDGATQLYVQDPDGHLVEIFSPPIHAAAG